MHGGPDTPANVDKSLEDRLSHVQLILVSNRGPFDFTAKENDFERNRGSGGLVTVLYPVGRYTTPVWVAAARTEGDRQIAAERDGESIRVEDDDASFLLRFVDLSPAVYERYYNVISNPLLWFVHHYMWDTPREPKIGSEEWAAWHDGYVPANRAFAEVVSDEIKRSEQPPIVIIQDYQLYLVARTLRDEHPDVSIRFFLHTPFPNADYLRILPSQMRDRILSSLLACDVVGFQTRRAATNFMQVVSTLIPRADVDYKGWMVEYEGRRTSVVVHPVSVDPVAVRDLAHGEEAERELEFLAPSFGALNIMRVDRIEPSKNIVRGFDAYDLLLDTHPELKERVKFLAFLVPPRPGIPEYERDQDEIMATAGRINIRHGTARWQPIELFTGNNYVRSLAVMRRYDVLLVNPLIDGMNLVSKEGVVVNERDGVLVLSDGAGSFEQLSPLPLSVSPADILGTAEALYTALRLSAEERSAMATELRRRVESEDAARWLVRQIQEG